jgi:hypothetical protein
VASEGWQAGDPSASSASTLIALCVVVLARGSRRLRYRSGAKIFLGREPTSSAPMEATSGVS